MTSEYEDFVISKNFKCPECGGDIKVFDTMFAKTWECVDCDYSDSDM